MWEIVGALGGRRACALRRVRRRLGCMLSAQSSHSVDVNFEIQAACKAFYANVRVLCDKKVSLQHLLQHFNAVVSPVACCAAVHRKIFNKTSPNLILHSAVGCDPLSVLVVMWIGRSMTQPWHENLTCLERAGSGTEHSL